MPHQNFFVRKIDVFPSKRQLFRGPQPSIECHSKITVPKIGTLSTKTVSRFRQVCQESFLLLKRQRVNRRTSFLLQVNPAVRILVDVLPLMGKVKNLAYLNEEDIHPSGAECFGFDSLALAQSIRQLIDVPRPNIFQLQCTDQRENTRSKGLCTKKPSFPQILVQEAILH